MVCAAKDDVLIFNDEQFLHGPFFYLFFPFFFRGAIFLVPVSVTGRGVTPGARAFFSAPFVPTEYASNARVLLLLSFSHIPIFGIPEGGFGY